ncbi:MAG: Two-component sensor protein [Actinotalea sp.]|nr:Two-component sensor protein [Actinotalea sp.]
MAEPRRSAADDATVVLGELAISAAGIGTFDWDLVDGRLTWDDQMHSTFGYAPGTFGGTIEHFGERVHPQDLPRVMQAVRAAIDTGGDFDSEYRVLLPTGETRWVAARGRALCDDDGTPVRFLGAAYDATARQDVEARVTRVLETMPIAFYSLDRDWHFTYVNAAAESILGRSRQELLGGVVWDLFPAAVESVFESSFRRALADGEPITFDAYYPEPLDGWYELRAWPGPDGLSVYFVDITERRADQERVEVAAERAALMAQVTSELAGTLDAEDGVARLAHLVVPALGDWCIVTLVDDEPHGRTRRAMRDVGWAHRDEEGARLVGRYTGLRLGALMDGSYLVQSLQSGRTVHVDGGATAAIAAVLQPGGARDLLVALAPDSVTVLPLRGRGRTVGLLSLFNSAERGPISPEDLLLAQQVADRAGLALDNSRLYRQQRQLAEGLQRSLLTEPPEPDHLQIVVRYEPAAEAAQVGGDWYDAFLQRDGATVLVIGDVVGHDVTAAAAMGQLRSLLRGIAVTTGAAPAEILTEVDQAMRTLQAETIATAVVARIEQRPDELERGITHVRWSNAGHPWPMVINPDATVAVLAAVQSDLLLGVLPDAKRVDSEVILDRGSTLLLYTDGLVENRGRGLKEGMAELRDILVDVAERDLGLDETCDEVLARMLPERPDDDVALVAVRLHRQDRPRPAEAGPNNVPPDVPQPPDVEVEPGRHEADPA